MVSSLGSGSRSSRARVVISIPGVQKPHCSPWQRMKPSCTGSSTPSVSRSSTVRTSRPPAIAARTVHVLTGSPSIQATHTPQLLVSQPQCVPVSPSSSRRKWTSSIRPSISRVTVSPLTLIVTCMSAVPSVAALRAGLVAGDAGPDAFDGRAQRAAGELVGEVPLEVGAAPVVAGGRAALGSEGPRPRVQLVGGSLAPQHLGDRGHAGRVRTDSREPDPGVGDDVAVHPDRSPGGRHRPVAGPPLDLGVGAGAVGPDRDPDLGQHLVVLDGRLVRPPVELLHVTTRSPAALRITQLASRAVHTAVRSSDGSAWQSDPPIVPRLRTTGSAITASASAKIGKSAASSGDCRSSRWRVIAPIRTSAAPTRT